MLPPFHQRNTLNKQEENIMPGNYTAHDLHPLGQLMQQKREIWSIEYHSDSYYLTCIKFDSSHEKESVMVAFLLWY
jgi:hypothetical protein